jgi:hypothetical protein
LDVLNVKDFQELKSLAKPPAGVDKVLECVMHLLCGIDPAVEVDKNGRLKDASWKAARKIMANPGILLRNLKNFSLDIDDGKVTQQSVDGARRVRDSMGDDFTEDVFRKKSCVAAGLVVWVINIIMYYDVAVQVQEDFPAEMYASALSDREVAIEKSGPTEAQLKAAIVELRSVAKPPGGILKVVALVGRLLDVDPTWKNMKVEMSRTDFLPRLLSLTSSAKPRADAYLTEEEVCPRLVSFAGHVLERWVRSCLQKEDESDDYILVQNDGNDTHVEQPSFTPEKALATAAAALGALDCSSALEPIRGVAKAIGLSEVNAFDPAALAPQKVAILTSLVQDPMFTFAAMKGRSVVTTLLADWMVKLVQVLAH